MDSGWNDLNTISEGLARASEQRRNQEKELSEKLGEPDAILEEDYGDYKVEVGFWRAKGGIVSYRRGRNKLWDSFTRQEYTDEKLALLAKVYRKQVRS